MALNAGIVFEVRTTGSDTNGAGFKTGASGTDWSLQDAAQYSVTDGVTNGTTTITSATANFGTDVVGNLIYVSGGTGSVVADRYEITVRNSATSITVDRSTGLTAGTGVTLKIGGAAASPGEVAGDVVRRNTVFIKNGTYSITSASNNVAAGCLAPSVEATWIGYSTTRTIGNIDTRPVLQLNVSTGTIWGTNSVGFGRNITFDGNNQTTSVGTANSSLMEFEDCHFINFNSGAILGACGLTRCSATGNSTTAPFGGGQNVVYSHCEAYANTVTAFTANNCFDCIAYANTGASTDGFAPGGRARLHNCTSYNNGRDGFRLSATSSAILRNCYAEGNAGWGLNVSAGTPVTPFLFNFAYYNNTLGSITGTVNSVGEVSTGGSQFADAAGNNFSLSGGSVLRNGGYPATFLRGTTPTYLDIGAARHQDPEASGTAWATRPRPFAPGLAR